MHQSLSLGTLSGLGHRKFSATGAVNGSLPLLRTVVQAAKTNPNEKRILPVFYHHLDPSKIPSSNAMDMVILAGDTVDIITRALLCVEGLYHLESFPIGSHSDLWEHFWPWARFLDVHRSLIPGAPTEDILRARLFCVMLDVGVGGSARVSSTPEIGILAAQVWGSYFREPNPLSELAVRRLAAFLGVRDEYRLEPFIEGAGGVDALAMLVAKMVHYLLNSNSAPELKTRNLGGVIDFSKRCKDEAWLRALRSHKVMPAMISVLLFIERLIDVPREQWVYREVYNQAWRCFFRLSPLDPSYTGAAEAIDAGILQVIASGVGRNLEWIDTTIRGILKYIVQSATVYYPVLAAIERALPLTQQAMSAPAFTFSALYPDWQEFVRISLDRLDIKRKFDSDEHIACKACDNLECGKILKKTEFKRCSGCEYQHYCSRECQIQDWRTGHRDSCQQARFPFPIEAPAYLTRRDRAFLRFVVAHDYERHKLEIFLARIVKLRQHGE
ncbi:hypothetical protein C8R45DRAFT_1080613, partial [Mycena sanguinolenta]